MWGEMQKKGVNLKKSQKKRERKKTESKAGESRGDDFGPPIWTGHATVLRHE